MNPNPFSALLTAPTSDNGSSSSSKADSSPVIPNEKINTAAENVFLFTLNKDSISPAHSQLLYLEQIATGLPSKLFNFDLLSHAVFERLLLANPQDFVIPNHIKDSRTLDIAESQVLVYLYQCYARNEHYHANNAKDPLSSDLRERIRRIILQNIGTALKQPELYENQNYADQWLSILQEYQMDWPQRQEFLSVCVKEVISSEEDEMVGVNYLQVIFNPFFRDISQRIERATLVSLEPWIFPALTAFVHDKTNPHLAGLLLTFLTPPKNINATGLTYSETILGQLLNVSILPKKGYLPYMYFENPYDQQSNLKATLWNLMKIHLDNLQALVKGFLLLGGHIRDGILTWLGHCLHVNTKRGQIWTEDPLGRNEVSSDGFMINLAGVLLRLSEPLLRPQLKVILVDPTYVSVTAEERAAKQVHMWEMDKETCLLPTLDDAEEAQQQQQRRVTAAKYNFITEIYFMTHKALDLGVRVSVDKLIQLNQSLAEAQSVIEGMDHATREHVMQEIQKQLQKFLSYLNTVLGLINDGLLVDFYEATAIWLCQVVVAKQQQEEEKEEAVAAAKGYAPGVCKDFDLPIRESNFQLLRSVPEFIFENIVGFFTFSKHFESEAIEIKESAQAAIFTMILVFMGSAERVKNPHLRARLAEGLECLLPKTTSPNPTYRSFTGKLFQFHPHRLEIVPNLLRVFVGIEMTGQNVQFEQKFNYRRPMYAIMEYLWPQQEQKQRFRELALEAEQDMEATDPPIFLRFVNLLINDAIFLLDESLNNLQQIRTLQDAENAGAWNTISQQERQQNQNNLRHLGMMTRFDNILGKDTINMLMMLTTEIKGIFTHSSMVDRIAAMLNYFLLNLVGPKQSEFKVRDKKEYAFNPAHTVLQICQIYVNLQESDPFCLAVSQDGRSYSPQLFRFAEEVLIKISGGQLIGEMQEFAKRVEQLDKQQKEDQEALADAPDEYLDPIMSTLMQDPVILPSSKVTVDRTTIARHLLSDQTDPFNRSPLSMDQVQPDVELRRRIQAWMQEKREAYSQNKGQQKN